ncbi:MAG: molybdopterin molybdotransferase MoeA, partial [Gammaproteobacteria bacterium]|nr:molybdopterin molybdotransferase MoeA [Gammaproteobacteria bacterium]
DIQLLDSSSIEIGSGHKKNQNFRYAGEDIKSGSTVFAKGHAIKAADLGVLASLGINEIKVVRKPRVSFFSTGDELKSIGDTLVKGEIYDSNRYSLYGLLSDCDVDIIDMGAVIDDPDTIRQTLLSAAACSDVILTSGGVSVGEADYIKGVLQEIGNMDIWKIAMKPGRPLTFGQIDNSMFFGLPGNPVAVMVTFYQFVKPALNKIKGMPLKAPLSLKATSLSSIRKNPGRREFQRAIASTDENGNLQVALTGKQGSGILTSMSQANCFIVLTEKRGSVEQGDQVDIQFFELY